MKKNYLSKPLLQIKKTGLLPVLDPKEACAAVARALLGAGVRVLELTADEHTAECLALLREQAPELTVGVQGVSCPEDAAALLRAGAAWIGTPGVCEAVAKACAEAGADCIPAVTAPGEIACAAALGLHVVRYSAAGREPGDFAALSDLAGDVNYLLTGVPRERLHAYLDVPQVLASAGRQIPRAKILLEDWDGIQADLTKEMLYLLDFHLGHVGYNTGSPENGKAIADRLETLFGFAQHPGAVNIFSDEKFELLTIPDGPGTHGHIQMLCSSVERARAFLERLHVEFAATAKYLPLDSKSAVLETTKEFILPPEQWDVEFSATAPDKYVFLHYLTEQIGEFAFHLGREFYR